LSHEVGVLKIAPRKVALPFSFIGVITGILVFKILRNEKVHFC
jgi:hypothetical protein